MDRFGVEGRVACVTGASSGIGRAMATALAQGGAKVVGIARRPEVLADWQAEAGGQTATVTADVGILTDLPQVAAAAAQPFGAPDILINAAGLNPRQHADDQTAEAWQATLDLNLSAPFFLAQAMVPGMRSKSWGRVLNIASLQTERAFPAGIAYGASKGGIGQLTRAMAEAWSKDGINTNAIAPGFFPTDLTNAVFSDPERAARNAAQTCIGRNGALDDLIGPMLFLCSPASAYVTGQVVYVDGGFTAK